MLSIGSRPYVLLFPDQITKDIEEISKFAAINLRQCQLRIKLYLWKCPDLKSRHAMQSRFDFVLLDPPFTVDDLC